MTTNKDLFAKHVGLQHFVETGTCLGRSVSLALELGFTDIRSVEAQPGRYTQCSADFAGDARVRLFYGESITMLPTMLADLNEPALFWIDAHPSGAGSYEIGHQTENIISELAIITNHRVNGHVILIDDLTADVGRFAKLLFPSAQIAVYDTDEGPAKVMEIKTVPSERVSLSQFNEVRIIENFFGGHIGQLIDIGAGAGVALSNSFELGLRGWHGLLVEASPIHFQNLCSNYIHRGGFELVNAALWTERKMMKFHLNSQLYSSLIAKDEPELYHAHYWVQTCTVEDLKVIQPEADLISIDIEGADILVFRQLIEAYPHCRLWVVEHAGKPLLRIDWQEMFEKHGLQILSETPENFVAQKV